MHTSIHVRNNLTLSLSVCSLTCVNGGTLNQTLCEKCQCPLQFTGTNCSTDVNECITSSPCQNGGTCANTYGGYSCTCPDTFTGLNCSIDVNECAQGTPCQNGATCTNTYGGFNCLCPTFFTGTQCGGKNNDFGQQGNMYTWDIIT